MKTKQTATRREVLRRLEACLGWLVQRAATAKRKTGSDARNLGGIVTSCLSYCDIKQGPDFDGWLSRKKYRQRMLRDFHKGELELGCTAHVRGVKDLLKLAIAVVGAMAWQTHLVADQLPRLKGRKKQTEASLGLAA